MTRIARKIHSLTLSPRFRLLLLADFFSHYVYAVQPFSFQHCQLGKLCEQIVLKSPQAFEKIQYVKSEPVDMQAYYIKKIERERAARKEYRMSNRQKADLNELFILDIMREEMENDDPRLF